MADNPKTTMLIILDGWGINAAHDGNAVFLGETPCLDRLFHSFPNTRLACSGESVGLPPGVMGNSEVGHLNIGAGRVVYQNLLRIDTAIKDRTFFKNPALDAVMDQVKIGGSKLHLMGLVSDGGVHSQFTHLTALLEMAREKGLETVCVHAILDGRDTPPDSGEGFIRELQTQIGTDGSAYIASICGRFYAMDRDKRWERVEAAYQLYTTGKGTVAGDPVKAVQAAYQKGETDEFISPVAIGAVAQDDAVAPGVVGNGDGIIFFNFRADRAREITRAFTDPGFDGFPRENMPQLCSFVCMTLYDETFTLPVAYPPVHLEGILGEVISRQGLRQLRIAETEKYAHVTYFFNGGEETPFPLEDRCMIPSPREVATYDLKPEMSAPKVTDEVLSRIATGNYNFIVLNFANMDMVGHTGVQEAAIKAVETVDGCLERIVNEMRAKGNVVVITADHGNAEKLIDDNGKPHTAHTTHPVPFILVSDTGTYGLRQDGNLGDIAPTILDIMGIRQPDQMTGKSLIRSR